MLWGQELKVYTYHSNLTKYALGSTSDRIYWWKQLIEEYGPEIIYIKGIIKLRWPTLFHGSYMILLPIQKLIIAISMK